MVREGCAVSAASVPFRHVVLEDLWDQRLLRMVHKEVSRIDDTAWTHTLARGRGARGLAVVEDKRSINFDRCKDTLAIVELHQELASQDFIGRVETWLGLSKLHFDTVGGGLHRIVPGGLLGAHVDFNVDAQLRWRRANVLVYLNECGAGGELKLYGESDEPQVTIAPKFNRTVVFECTESSWHGHPTPLAAGPDRLSVAAYYFTYEKPPVFAEPHSTIFREVAS